MDKPKRGDFYEHYRGQVNQILAVAIHSETKQELVIYSEFRDRQVHAMPIDIFQCEMEPGVKRFKKVEGVIS